MKTERKANFSSSSAWKLTTNNVKKDGFGKPGLTYISEKRMEMRLGRELQKEHSAKATTWGTFVETRVFDELLGLKYLLESKKRYAHETIPHWTGSPDVITSDIVGDIKCPYTLKSFCETVDTFGDLEAFKKLRPEYWWQLVSNGILTGRDKAEIIIYCPYKDELEEIKESAADLDGNQNSIAWIYYAFDDELPYLIKGGYYKNINIFAFDIPQEDKDFLTERVEMAIKLLNE